MQYEDTLYRLIGSAYSMLIICLFIDSVVSNYGIARGAIIDSYCIYIDCISPTKYVVSSSCPDYMDKISL